MAVIGNADIRRYSINNASGWVRLGPVPGMIGDVEFTTGTLLTDLSLRYRGANASPFFGGATWSIRNVDLYDFEVTGLSGTARAFIVAFKSTNPRN